MEITLNLRVADTFSSRLLGLHALADLTPDEGLLLLPCRAIHTFFQATSIDVVFLDQSWRERRCIHDLPPWRMAGAVGARMAIELSAGYCRRHPDYLKRIHVALQLRVSPCLSK